MFGFGFFIQILVCSSIFHYWVLEFFFVIGFLGLFRYWVFVFFFSVIFVLPLLIFYFVLLLFLGSFSHDMRNRFLLPYYKS